MCECEVCPPNNQLHLCLELLATQSLLLEWLTNMIRQMFAMADVGGGNLHRLPVSRRGEGVVAHRQVPVGVLHG